MVSIIKLLLLTFLITPVFAFDFTILENGFVQTSDGIFDNLTSKVESDWYFSLEGEYDDVRIFFPKTTTLKSIDTNTAYLIGYDNSLFVQFENSERIVIKYSFEEPSSTNYLLLIILFSIPILIIVFLLLKLRKVKDKVLKTLNERERQVFLTIRKEKSVKQSKLRRLTGLPKSTLSRTIDSLERKGLIKKQGYGMTNRLLIK